MPAYLLRVILWVFIDQMISANYKTQGSKGQSVVNLLHQEVSTWLFSLELSFWIFGLFTFSIMLYCLQIWSRTLDLCFERFEMKHFVIEISSDKITVPSIFINRLLLSKLIRSLRMHYQFIRMSFFLWSVFTCYIFDRTKLCKLVFYNRLLLTWFQFHSFVKQRRFNRFLKQHTLFLICKLFPISSF